MIGNVAKIFAGNSNTALAKEVVSRLDVQLGRATVGRFSDGEINVEIHENVRSADVFVVQSTCSPANENLMELLVMIDALRRASAEHICAVIPYYGYGRQDRKVAPRTPITAKLVADIIATSGASRVLSIDMHAGQIQGFFNIPFDHLYAMPVLLDHLRQNFDDTTVVVSPDAGGMERARAYAKRIDASLGMIDKRRPQPNVAKVMNVIGEVKDRDVVLVDDMIDTAGTLTKAADMMMEQGASSVRAVCTHAVLSGQACERIQSSALTELIVTDTIPISEAKRAATDKIKQLSVAQLFADVIKRVRNHESISSHFIIA